MTQVAWLKHATGVEYGRPVDGYVMYTAIDFEYHSQLSIQCINDVKVTCCGASCYKSKSWTGKKVCLTLNCVDLFAQQL